MSQEETGVEEEEALVTEAADEEPVPTLEEVGEEDACEDWVELEECTHQSSYAETATAGGSPYGETVHAGSWG